ncbi:MAG TPA: sulfur reduction protein DsrJ [Lamprocystis sp. (in: g-proteobacteria)]|nr:sulfur reduction protein DsrJ [Lamprocystis sp. (in: g-proteobacteria)]
MNERARIGTLEALMVTVLGRVWLVIIGLVWVLSAQNLLAGEVPNYVKPGSKAAGLTACVEPTNLMRRYHFELIQHQRDATVRSGIRSTKHSLAGCIDCHVTVDPTGRAIEIDGRDQFCGACHAFSAVNLACFGCHASVPKGGPLSEAALAGRIGQAVGTDRSGLAPGGQLADTLGRAVSRGGGQ